MRIAIIGAGSVGTNLHHAFELKGIRTEGSREEPTGLPVSDVLYFELEKGCWVCVRPSGTEPKIKLYVNSNDRDKAEADALNERLCEASKAMMA